jgi:hypothetical protein
MNASPHTISKTSFLKFEQCPKAFYFYKNHPYLRDKISVDRRLTFRRGHTVGEFAQSLFPGGTDVSRTANDTSEALRQTAVLIENRQEVIYEAAFCFDGVLVMIDILCLTPQGYVAYEVKSSLKVSENYLKDAYLQYYVLKNSLPVIDDMFLVTLNPDYVLHGELEPRKLFRKRSVKLKAEENIPYFRFQIHAANEVLNKNSIPNIPIGRQCFRPYQCDYFGTCWKENLGPGSVFNFPMANRNTQFEWHSAGYKQIDEVPDEIIKKESLVRIKNAYLLNEPIINYVQIEKFLSTIREPVVAMDMEIWNPAIPQIQGTGPFEQIPFLACFFDAKESTHYFSEYTGDDRKNFALALIEATSSYNTVLVYDRNLEAGVMDNLSRLYPELAPQLAEVKGKLVDIFEVFLHIWYYDPAFMNNFSLKAVSAVLLSQIEYKGIVSGLEAMNVFEEYRGSSNDLEKEAIKAQLVEYCNTDTEATYGLMEFLRNRIK